MILIDFVVLNLKEDVNMPIIFGRTFLAIVRTIIYMKNEKLKFWIGDKEIKFNLNDIVRNLSITDEVYAIDIVDE